jgi:DMSO/TMAO reductase YedYZ molybdopterin-dependent catalytic subunit
MTPRGTDWGLAVLVAVLAVSGVETWFSATPSERWVFALHDSAGFALGGLLAWKLRRVWRRALAPSRWDRRTRAGILAAVLVGLALVSGWAWSTGARGAVAGYTLLAWHVALGGLLAVATLAHALLRAKRPRRRDLADRRQLLTAAAVGAGAYAAWRLQRPVSRALGLGGDARAFTGSYDAGDGDFPVTSWIADDPRPLDPATYRLSIGGEVERPLGVTADELAAGDELEATLDCTGGFRATRRWRGIRLDRLVARAGPRRSATHVRVISHTGYRASFRLDEAAGLLLATPVDGETLGHGHGAPARLVAPRRRGFQWVKWVTRIELADGPDPGAIASTVWRSFTPEGRGAA